MAKSSTRRTQPAISGTTQDVGTLSFTDQLIGKSLESLNYAQYGHPARLKKVAHQITAAPGIFPNCQGNATASSISSLTLASIPANVSIVGMILSIVSGTGLGQWRYITGVTGTVATVSPDWSVLPASTAEYDVLVDCYRLGTLLAKVEYSDSDPNHFINARIVLSSPPDVGEAPIYFVDEEKGFDNYGFSHKPSQAGYFHARGRSVDARGMLGAKIHVSSVEAGTTASIWLGAT